MNKKPYRTVDFEVVEIWYNNIYEPYTLKARIRGEWFEAGLKLV